MCQGSKIQNYEKNLSIENQPHVTMSHESANQNTNKEITYEYFGCAFARK